MSESREPARPSGGFSLIELLVVVAVIAILAAISLPAISNYLRHYKIKGAAQQVGGEIQAARGKAINKNVNLGVVFVTIDANSYRWVVEDDQNPTDADYLRTSRMPVSSLVIDPQQAAQAGPVRALPIGVVFSQACAPPNTPPGGDWDQGMRFNRLGGLCNPDGTGEPCPDLDTGAELVHNNSTDSYVCLEQPDTGLTRWVQVRVGGRVEVQP